MSTPQTPQTPDSREARLIGDLLALARNAQKNADPRDLEDDWYWLGQRNAYAFATGLLVGPTLGADSFVVADRIIAALNEGITDVAALREQVYLTEPRATTTLPRLHWVGPHAFTTAHLSGPGVEENFGLRWGNRADRRASLRVEAGAVVGLLYAYDSTWDEYAVLARLVSRAQVSAAFTVAQAIDSRMDVDRFAGLVQAATAPASMLAVVEPRLLTHEAQL